MTLLQKIHGRFHDALNELNIFASEILQLNLRGKNIFRHIWLVSLTTIEKSVD